MNYVYFKLNQILQKQQNKMMYLFPAYNKNKIVVINPLYEYDKPDDVEISNPTPNPDIENNCSSVPVVVINKDDKPENKFYSWMEYIVCPLFFSLFTILYGMVLLIDFVLSIIIMILLVAIILSLIIIAFPVVCIIILLITFAT